MVGAHSLTSCLGQVGDLGKGAPVLTSRAQPSKLCSGRSQKRLLPLLLLWLPLSLARRPPTAVSVALHSGFSPPFPPVDPFAAPSHSAVSPPAKDSLELQAFAVGHNHRLSQGQSVINQVPAQHFPKCVDPC